MLKAALQIASSSPVSADDLIPAICFCVAQARLKAPFVTEQWIEQFAVDLISKEAQQRVLVYSAHNYVLEVAAAELGLAEFECEDELFD